MKNSQLNRVVRLISRTHDKAIVLDQETEEVVVMLPLDNYENMMGVESSEPEFPPLDDGEIAFDLPENEPTATDLLDNDHPFAFEEQERDSLHQKQNNRFTQPKQSLNFDHDWAPAGAPGVEAEENLDDVPHEEEEEKFYLEPIDEV